MKNLSLHITIALILLTLPKLGWSQQNISSFDVEGLKVIHKQIPNEIVAVRLYIRGGTANYPPEKQGIEALAFEMALFGGTESRTSEQIFHATRDLGIGLSGKSGYDYGYLGMTALKINWDESWDLWSEAVTNPLMPEGAFEAFRDEIYARNRRVTNSAEEKIEQLSLAATFAGTDYEKNPNGNEDALYNLTADEVIDHYINILTKGNCFLVIVGDISREDITSKISASFGALPEGEATEAPTQPSVKSPAVTIQHRDLDLNHIQGRMAAPERWSDEEMANLLAMSILTDRLVEEIANKQQVSYTPSAYSGAEHRFPSNSLYAATVSPVKTVRLLVEEINRAKREGFTEEEVEDKKPLFTTLHYLSQETVDAQAHVLGDAEIAGDWQKAIDITPEIRNTSVAEINRVFNKYSDWIHWTYLGNASQVEAKDFPQPETGSKENEEE